MVALFNPAGPISSTEELVIVIAIALMLVVVVPVFAMTFWFAWKYRASNRKARYMPNWSRSKAIEVVVWLVPALIVSGLAVLAWRTTHELSPYKPIASADKPLRVNVVAMNWKWLFIYPQLHIATINQLVMPTNRPVRFRLTSDSVIAAFFIPRLGTQIYAMPGMRTKLHLLADKTGTFAGRNFQLSGRGYSWMDFQVRAVSPRQFDRWVAKVRRSPRRLDLTALQKIEQPSAAAPIAHYGSIVPHLFRHVIGQVRSGHSGGAPAGKEA